MQAQLTDCNTALSKHAAAGDKFIVRTFITQHYEHFYYIAEVEISIMNELALIN